MTLAGIHRIEQVDENKTRIYAMSIFGKMNSIVINVPSTTFNQKYNHYQTSGECIQNIFTELTADEREFIMTGLTKEDWDVTFN